MGKYEKILDRVLSGRADQNIEFEDLVRLLEYKGFTKRHKGGSHQIFTKSGVSEMINLQSDGPKAKAYQVRQVRTILTKYSL